METISPAHAIHSVPGAAQGPERHGGILRCAHCGAPVDTQSRADGGYFYQCPQCFRVFEPMAADPPRISQKTHPAGKVSTRWAPPLAIWATMLLVGTVGWYVQYAIQWNPPRDPIARAIHDGWCQAFDCADPRPVANPPLPIFIHSHQLRARTDQPKTLELRLTIGIPGEGKPVDAIPPVQLTFVDLEGRLRYETVIPIQSYLVTPPRTRPQAGLYPLTVCIPDPGEEVVHYRLAFHSPDQLGTIPLTAS